MKQILFVLLLLMSLPTMAMPGLTTRGNGTIVLKLSYHDAEGFERGKRSPLFIPIRASYDVDNLYLDSKILMENITICIKDESDNIVYENSSSLLPNVQTTFPIYLDEGTYTLEIENGSITYCGDFEI